jgi:mRNA interferase MazF
MTTLAMPLVKRRIGRLPLALQTDCLQVLQRVIGGQG